MLSRTPLSKQLNLVLSWRLTQAVVAVPEHALQRALHGLPACVLHRHASEGHRGRCPCCHYTWTASSSCSQVAEINMAMFRSLALKGHCYTCTVTYYIVHILHTKYYNTYV